jgi:hypothetical protein
VSVQAAERVATVAYELWINPADLGDPRRWRGKYAAAVTRYGFVEVEPPRMLADGCGGYVACGTVRRGDNRPMG